MKNLPINCYLLIVICNNLGLCFFFFSESEFIMFYVGCDIEFLIVVLFHIFQNLLLISHKISAYRVSGFGFRVLGSGFEVLLCMKNRVSGRSGFRGFGTFWVRDFLCVS